MINYLLISFPDSNNEKLYHFYINSEDYIVEFITDEKPRIKITGANDYSS